MSGTGTRGACVRDNAPMLRYEDSILLVGRRWNYVIGSVFSACLAVASAAFLIQFLLPRQLTAEAVIVTLFGAFMAATAVNLAPNAVYANRIELDPKGLTLYEARHTSRWIWQEYAGMRGGPALLLRVRAKAGKPKSISIGLWRINLEIVIYEYAKSHGIDVPIRPEAYHQVGPASLLLVAGGLVLVAIAIGTFGLSTI